MIKAMRRRAHDLLWHGPFAPIAAAFDILNPAVGKFLSEPLNGQAGRRDIIEEILRIFPCTSIIETGTFRGASTRYLGDLRQAKVISIEAVARYHWYARFRLRRHRWVQLITGDSQLVLKSLSADRQITDAATLFYLDAHWHEALPLGVEMRLIAENWRAWVAVIDDFRVPGDPEYGFDDYGMGKALETGYLKQLDLPNLQLFWPRLRAADETGLRRGCVVVTNNAEVANALIKQSKTLSPEVSGFEPPQAAHRYNFTNGESR